jgi:hypothetical protein
MDKLLVQLNAGELSAIVQDAVETALAKTSTATAESAPVETPDTYLTQSQACDMLKITKPTIIRLGKVGLVKPRYMGKRVLYSKLELEQSLRGGADYADTL